jgi:hypothetical protein
MNLSFISNFIPGQVAAKMTPQLWALVFECAVEGVQWAQAELKHLDPDIRKKEALDFAKKTYKLAMVLAGDPELKNYVHNYALPSAVDGTIKTFNLAGWFETAAQVEYGGKFSTATGVSVSKLPMPTPAIAPNPNMPSQERKP